MFQHTLKHSECTVSNLSQVSQLEASHSRQRVRSGAPFGSGSLAAQQPTLVASTGASDVDGHVGAGGCPVDLRGAIRVVARLHHFGTAQCVGLEIFCLQGHTKTLEAELWNLRNFGLENRRQHLDLV